MASAIDATKPETGAPTTQSVRDQFAVAKSEITALQTATLVTPVSVANGGTGATNAGAALTALGAAPLASPALAGNPTAPTPATADNGTSIATTAFVKAQGYGVGTLTGVTAGAGITVSGAAPSPTVALTTPVTVANGGTGATTAGAALTSLGGAPLASPSFTGDPRAPTPATADNDTSVATTAYVQAQGYATSASVTAGYLPLAGGTLAGTLAVGGNATAVLDITGGNYTGLHAPDNAGLIYIGTATGVSGVSIHRNVHHQFQDVGGTINWGVFEAIGLTVGVDITLSRTDISNGFIFRPNTSGFKNLAFGTTGQNTLDQVTFLAVTVQNNGAHVVGSPTGGSKGVGTINATGVYANNVLLTSDAALKRDIEPVPACLPLVEAVEPKRFKFVEPSRERERDDEGMPIPEAGPPGWFERTRWGLVAQDVEAAMAAAGHDFGGLDKGPDGIRSLPVGDLVGVLWQAVRELSAKVEALEGKPA